MADFDLLYQGDHLTRALDRLPIQYRGKVTWEAWMVRAIAPEIQRLEDQLQTIGQRVFVLSDQTTGVWLELWGKVLDIERQGFPDTYYLRMLRAQAAANRSTGTADELIDVLSMLALDAPVELYEYSPATASLSYLETLTEAQRGIVAQILTRMKPIGVRLDIIEAGPAGEGFGWLDDPTAAGFWQGTFTALVTAPRGELFQEGIRDGLYRPQMWGAPNL